MRTTGDRRGMSLIEMTICLLIALALVEMTVPLAENGVRRARELEARACLRDLRRAIDRWHDDARARSEAPATAWPPTLSVLVEQRYLRRIPSDPLTGQADWLAIPATGAAADVFDVRTRAAGQTLDGVDYADL